MIKLSFFPGADDRGVHVVPLFGPADSFFEKTAAPLLLPEVTRYIASLRPQKDAQYVLLNAMGAGEWWGSNVNGDHFPHAALVHAPNDWTGNPLLDREKAKDWAYGYPTFYNASPFAHHRNKNAAQAFGDVELAAWNPHMKRVELVTRLDEDKCQKFGGQGVWDKLKSGEYVDCSMGCRVPFDACSICLDWSLYRKAEATFDPKKDKSPGDAILAFHKKLIKDTGHGIRGLSITRKDYCEHGLRQMNHILPDGRKVFVYNDYPKFFDISFVFVGADKTAKVMMKIAGAGRSHWFMNGAELAEKLGYVEDDGQTKVASVQDEALKHAFLGKVSTDKDAEIIKDVVPSQFAGKAIPALTRSESDLPTPLLDALGLSPMEEALSTPSAMGMVLRPREFQRVILICSGNRLLADKLDEKGVVFPKTDEKEDVPMGPGSFSPLLAKLLAPFMDARSAFGPAIEKRVLVGEPARKEKRAMSSSLSSELLRKIGAAYNGYRAGVMDLVIHAQDFAAKTPYVGASFHKLASMPADSLITSLTAHYLKYAFWDERAPSTSAGVERAPGSRGTPGS